MTPIHQRKLRTLPPREIGFDIASPSGKITFDSSIHFAAGPVSICLLPLRLVFLTPNAIQRLQPWPDRAHSRTLTLFLKTIARANFDGPARIAIGRHLISWGQAAIHPIQMM
jgi:hypothetical protein